MSSHNTIVPILTSLFATAALAEPPTAAVEAYMAGSQVIVAELNKSEPNVGTITTTITAMLEHAKPVVFAFGEKHTQCAEQLARMIELYPQIEIWSAAEIRRNIEAGSQLPRAEGCYAARDVVAHPAIVRAITRAGVLGQQARLLREMNEAIEHMQEISTDLSE